MSNNGREDGNEKIRFRYHPNIYEDDILVHKNGICQCCGKQISEYIER